MKKPARRFLILEPNSEMVYTSNYVRDIFLLTLEEAVECIYSPYGKGKVVEIVPVKCKPKALK